MQPEQFRQLLSAAVDELYRKELITATGGNISLRLPHRKGFLITPSGMFKGKLGPAEMVALDDRGRPIDDEAGVPSIETSLHLHIYRLRPHLNAVVHTHAPAATIAGLYKLEIPPFTAEMIRFAKIPLVPFYLPGSAELAAAAAAALEKQPAAQALLLQNHGLVAMGQGLRKAIDITVSLEEACRMSIICRLLGGKPVRISKKEGLLVSELLKF